MEKRKAMCALLLITIVFTSATKLVLNSIEKGKFLLLSTAKWPIIFAKNFMSKIFVSQARIYCL